MGGCIRQQEENNFLQMIMVNGLSYETITQAIKEAQVNDTIFLLEGILDESIIIDKPLIIQGISPQKTKLILTTSPDPIITIDSSFVSIHNLSLSHDFPEKRESKAIHIKGSSNSVHHLSVSSARYGIYFDSLSERNQVTHSSFVHNDFGIYLNHAHYNKISCNRFSDHLHYAIYFTSRSSESLVSNNNFTSNSVGLHFKTSEFNIVSNNTFFNNTRGVTICCLAQNNLIYANNFIKNTVHAVDPIGNQWFLDTMGNYWDDYNGTNKHHDGRGDTPYVIHVEAEKIITQDMYPLLQKTSDLY